MEQQTTQVVFTNKARCRDCYRCIRMCPVKAISMRDGQAYVVASRCIACGTCIRECPQNAKQFRSDLTKAQLVIKEKKKVAASIAPSFAAVYPEWQRKRLASALRRLGFAYIGETAEGAWVSAHDSKAHIETKRNQSHILSACPAVVSYIEHYRQGLLSTLVPVASPMIAHARILKERLGAQSGCIFIGPCVAKKAEAERPEFKGLVDCVLTFSELDDWLAQAGINLSECEESDFDGSPRGDSRFYPVEGGCLKTAGIDSSLFRGDILPVSGFNAVEDALTEAGEKDRTCIVEPLMCEHGCINGPCAADQRNRFERKRSLLKYCEGNPGKSADTALAAAGAYSFSSANDDQRPVSEAEIRRILEMTGKGQEEEQLNCGACGYMTCRDKAIAVARGLAEPEMCISFMRRKAEQRTDRIIETSPNGILILDEQLRILHMNPAFRRFFVCSNSVLGKPISYLMDPQPFAALASGQELMTRTVVEHPKYNLICHEFIYSLPDEKQYVGIFVNITGLRASQRRLDVLREKTVLQAQELLAHQLRMSEDIAKCLGENIAKSQDILEKLTDIALNSAGSTREPEEDE